MRDMLLDLTDATEGIFDDGTPAEELSLDEEAFGELHAALVATKKGAAGGKGRKQPQQQPL